MISSLFKFDHFEFVEMRILVTTVHLGWDMTLTISNINRILTFSYVQGILIHVLYLVLYEAAAT